MQFGTILIKNLTLRKTRSLLTIIGIAVGIAAVVALISISNGFLEIWGEAIAQREIDLIVIQKADVSNSFFSSINQSEKEKLKSIPGVKAVTGVLIDFVTINDWPWIPVYGQEADAFMVSHLNFLEGKNIRPGEKEIIMGKILAQNLNMKVGEEVDIEADIFKVVGIYEGGSMYEEGLVMIDLYQLQQLILRENRVTSFNIQVEDPNLISVVKESIEASFPSFAALEGKEAGNKDFGLQLIRAMSWGISCIALIIGVIATINTMLMSVIERTKEIGILRALGWKRRKVLKMILGEAVLLSFLGGISGCILGVLVVKLITIITAVFPHAQSIISGSYSPKLFLQALVIAFSLGLGGGIYPAYRASGFSPMEAMRRD